MKTQSHELKHISAFTIYVHDSETGNTWGAWNKYTEGQYGVGLFTNTDDEIDEKRREQLAEESIKIDELALKISYEIFTHVQGLIKSNDKPSGIASLSQAATNAQKLAKLALGEATHNMNLNANIQETDAFREAMELLDSVAEQRRESNDKAVH